MQDKLKVLLIDDHPLMRRGIKQLVELDDNFEVVADRRDFCGITNIT